ncbi:hypothetical protein DFH08DRAFT_1007945 [Mycena albidolilacea]|uniref:Uncharacterized protein n=1 Tax=Mycena albidolilacea TaxID=1033008 RepID=A0AAD6ZZR7_9AGAR|nr:hypothetical protein DFH08DRAFT_1007945 [Mycena albidolilacea]
MCIPSRQIHFLMENSTFQLELTNCFTGSNDPGSFDRMAIQLGAGEVRDSQFSDPELNDTPAPPPIIFQNVFPPIPAPIQNPPPINPPVTSLQQAQYHWQTSLPGANGARMGPSKHAPRRCAVFNFSSGFFTDSFTYGGCIFVCTGLILRYLSLCLLTTTIHTLSENLLEFDLLLHDSALSPARPGHHSVHHRTTHLFDTALAPGKKPNIPESRIIEYLAQQLQANSLHSPVHAEKFKICTDDGTRVTDGREVQNVFAFAQFLSDRLRKWRKLNRQIVWGDYGCHSAKRDRVRIGRLGRMMRKDLEFDWLQLTPKEAVAPERVTKIKFVSGIMRATVHLRLGILVLSSSEIHDIVNEPF